MTRIDAVFQSLRAKGERALIPFVTAGDPDLDTTEALLPILSQAGADIIEIGVPFSDPTAEGPTIQRASERALIAGTSLRRILAMVERVRGRMETPIVLMGYANPFLQYGVPGFAEAALRAGVDGVIVADLPPEEEPAFFASLYAVSIAPILLVAPTSTAARTIELARQTRGFLYYVSLTGVTGARRALPDDLVANLARIRENSDIPLCVGFGISTPEQAAFVGEHADGVVVGSAIVERVERAGSREQALDDVAAFVAELKTPLRGGSAS